MFYRCGGDEFIRHVTSGGACELELGLVEERIREVKCRTVAAYVGVIWAVHFKFQKVILYFLVSIAKLKIRKSVVKYSKCKIYNMKLLVEFFLNRYMLT
jgi:hypothetical protein